MALDQIGDGGIDTLAEIVMQGAEKLAAANNHSVHAVGQTMIMDGPTDKFRIFATVELRHCQHNKTVPVYALMTQYGSSRSIGTLKAKLSHYRSKEVEEYDKLAINPAGIFDVHRHARNSAFAAERHGFSIHEDMSRALSNILASSYDAPSPAIPMITAEELGLPTQAIPIVAGDGWHGDW